jgi:hypothetical protein
MVKQFKCSGRVIPPHLTRLEGQFLIERRIHWRNIRVLVVVFTHVIHDKLLFTRLFRFSPIPKCMDFSTGYSSPFNEVIKPMRVRVEGS